MRACRCPCRWPGGLRFRTATPAKDDGPAHPPGRKACAGGIRPGRLSGRERALRRDYPISSNAFLIHSGAASPDSATTSKRHGGSVFSVVRYWRAAAISFFCLAGVTLAAAPPKSARERSRTSTNTRVSPSCMMRSISPKRQRQLRATHVSPCAVSRRSARFSADCPSRELKLDFTVDRSSCLGTPYQLRLDPFGDAHPPSGIATHPIARLTRGDCVACLCGGDRRSVAPCPPPHRRTRRVPLRQHLRQYRA